MYRKILAGMALLLGLTTGAHAGDHIVGGDMSLVPAYEAAGDKWLDAEGKTITDLITYVKEQGWNAVRVRLFLDPTTDSDPGTCQDLDYVKAFGKRIKDAGMAFMLDFHYSDTWADPGSQGIPAEWKGDTSVKGLASQLYQYTYESIQTLIESGATPDYVQIGNEITYGLLWNTSDGKYPSNSSQYASAGYCPTWSANYSTGTTQWKRTAQLLANAAQAIHKCYNDNGLDSTSVKLIVHTELGNNKANSDNFYKHIRTAGFKNYDIIGLSYYPFWHGPLATLDTILDKLKTDFPDKEVQIVETAWYNSYYPYTADGTNEYCIASLNSNWTASGNGMVLYLKSLVADLKEHSNVTGVMYWFPEECGSGKNKNVQGGWTNRGMWKNSSSASHTIQKANDGTTPIQALASYVEATGINAPMAKAGSSTKAKANDKLFDLQGRPVSQTTNSPHLIYIKGSKKVAR